MNRKILNLFLVCALISCNREESIPSYISVNSFELDTNNIQGSDNHEITEVNINANGQNLGTFSFEKEIPILTEGSTNLIISPVIKQNGLEDERVIYPLYTSYFTTEDLAPNQTVEISPVISYRDNLNFWVEDFDNSISFSQDVVSEGDFIRIDDSNLTFGGTGDSAVSQMDEGGSAFYAQTDEAFDWPVGQPVFLELDYSCNQSFVIGALAGTSANVNRADLVIVLPTQDSEQTVWRKLYINLTDFVADNASALSYEVAFYFNKESDVTEPKIYLDNLKVIYP